MSDRLFMVTMMLALVGILVACVWIGFAERNGCESHDGRMKCKTTGYIWTGETFVPTLDCKCEPVVGQ